MVKFRQLLTTISIVTTLVVSCAFAQTNLTQILDSITNPDGSSFNGTVVITWNGYSGSGSGTVSRLSTSARVYNGALSVLLVPTTTASPGTYYQVVYTSSNGVASWTETWQVPPSTTALALAAVRQTSTEGTGTGGGTTGGGTGSTQYATLPIAISQVTSLASSLSTINTTLGTVQSNATALGTTLSGLNTTVSGLNTSVTGQGTTLSNLSGTVAGLNTTVSGLNSTVTGLSTTLTGQTSTLNTLNSTVTGQGTTLTNLSNTVAGLNTTVTGLSTTLTGQTSTLNALNSTVTGQGTTLTNLSNTVAGLNTTVTNQAASISSLNSTVGSLTSSLSTQGTSLTALTSSVGALTTTVTGQGSSISSLTSSVSSLGTTVSGNTTTLNTVSNTVGGLSSNVTSLTNLVNGLNATVNTLSAAGSTAVFVDAESPAGALNGANLAFSLANTPAPASSLTLFRNGLSLTQGADYTLAGTAITFKSTTVPQTSDILTAYYRMAGTGSPTNFTDGEIPAGTVNGTNVSFTLGSSPNPAASLRLYRNGMLVAGSEYTLSGSSITFVAARTPQTGDSLTAYYRH